jgi:3-isopropylmalate/(R)-2-methylmalate dehydratase small subunit
MAEPLRQHTGRAVTLMIDNIDTDQIIPSREMKTVSRTGLADGLFAGWRYTEPGSRIPAPDFVLNRYPSASIIVSGENFGCGSSREHAVWALAEYGIRVIIARSFGEIFSGNCIRNGILPVILPSSDIDRLASAGDDAEISVDVDSQSITAPMLADWKALFEIGAFQKAMLMEGLDPISLTLKRKAQIESFLLADKTLRPWVY